MCIYAYDSELARTWSNIEHCNQISYLLRKYSIGLRAPPRESFQGTPRSLAVKKIHN